MEFQCYRNQPSFYYYYYYSGYRFHNSLFLSFQFVILECHSIPKKLNKIFTSDKLDEIFYKSLTSTYSCDAFNYWCTRNDIRSFEQNKLSYRKLIDNFDTSKNQKLS